MSVRTSSRSHKGQNKHNENLIRDENTMYNNDNVIRNVRLRKPAPLKEVVVEIVKCLPCDTNDSNYDEDKDVLGEMIQCDNCDTWQHIGCMTGDLNKDNLEDIKPYMVDDDKYYCSICRPDLYPHLKYHTQEKKTLRNKENIEKDEVEPEIIDSNDDEEYVDIPLNDGFQQKNDDIDFIDKNDDIYDDLDINLNVRKKRTIKEQPKRANNKKPKNATSRENEPTTDNTPTPKSIEQYDKIRENAKKMLINLFIKYLIPDTIAEKTFTLPANTTIETLAEQMGKTLEEATFQYYLVKGTRLITKEYSEKIRSLFSNLKDKKNSELKTHVLNESLTMENLVKMTVNELANPDLQRFKKRRDSKTLNEFTIETNEGANVATLNKTDDSIIEPDEIYSKDNIRRRSTSNEEEQTNDLKRADASLEKKIGEKSNDDVIEIMSDSNDTHSGKYQKYRPSMPRRIEVTDPETEWRTTGYLKLVGETMQMDASIYSNVISDGKFFIEGRLSTNKGFAYLNEIKTLRNVVTFQLVNVHDPDSIANLHAMAESLLISNKILGIPPKVQYVKTVYVVGAENNIMPDIFQTVYDNNETVLSKVESFDKALFFIFIIRPETIN
ncbi:Transcription factor bye1 [Maudiozyma exigua]|uniref:Transcription factor BYE1 n=1 Tax=Maudiozyma exigua TaxID=34358 RepID=A0A9P6W5B9_MAUEX|nr:Transcription factor bye1 [Kazachstania exigua]